MLARRHETVLRRMFAGAAIVTLACILRELEFDPEGSMGWADRLLRGPGRIIAVVIAIPVGIYSLGGTLQDPWAAPRLLLGSWWGRSAVAGGLIIVLGALYDRGVFVDLESHRWEEASETLGYALIAVSTFMPRRIAIEATSAPPDKTDES